MRPAHAAVTSIDYYNKLKLEEKQYITQFNREWAGTCPKSEVEFLTSDQLREAYSRRNARNRDLLL